MSARKAGEREAPKPGAPTLGTPWAAAVVALLVVLFFHEIVVGGKTFVSPDATAPAGFARIGERALFHDHVYPLWNPFVFLGMPSFASGTYNPLIYPPDWPVALLQRALPVLPELTWMLIYYVVAGLGLFLLAREWGAGPEGALLGAVAFVFGPNLVAVGSHGHGSQLVDSAYLPLMLWLGTRWMRNGRLSDLAWLALAGGFQLLRGHVQICFYTWLALGAYVLIEGLGALRTPARAGATVLRAAGIACAAALAFGIAGVYNLPLADYARQSIRGTSEGGGVGREYATQWSLAPYELPSVVIPGWVGFGGQTYWGGMPFTDYPNAYVGMVAVVLALPAFLAGGVPRVFALALAALSLMIAFGRNFPLYGLLYDHLPLFNKFRVPVMIVLLFQLAAALGLAWGWSALRNGGAQGRERALGRILMGGALAMGAVLIAGAMGRGTWEAGYAAAAVATRAAAGQPFPQELAQIAARELERDLVRAALLGIAAIGLGWAVWKRRVPGSLASVGVLLLLLIELWPVSGRVMKPALGEPAERDASLGRDDVVEFLEQQGPPGSFRILPIQEFQTNRYAGFGIASLGGYHAAKPRLVQTLIDAGAPNAPLWLRLLNVRFLVLAQQIDPPPGFRLVHQGSQFVYENDLVLPRATVLGGYSVVRPDSAIIDSVAIGSRDAASWTYLAEDPHLALGPVAGARATLVSYALNDVTVDVETPGPGLLRLADPWSPDWRARVDGQPTPLLRADYLLRAVPVPAGRHRVTFRFESPAMRRGLLVSVASLGGVLLLFAFPAFLRRRPDTPLPEAR